MNLNNRQIQHAMKRMGIAQVDIPATEVIIRTADSEIVISDPQVAKVNMMGQTTFQVSGNISERPISSEPEINEEDIATVMDQTGATKEKALSAIKAAKGDLAQAILDLKS
ncbi:MAG: nascent polypeptide-associated complex protein [Candidatus Woesearchaeota archaeon]